MARTRKKRAPLSDEARRNMALGQQKRYAKKLAAQKHANLKSLASSGEESTPSSNTLTQRVADNGSDRITTVTAKLNSNMTKLNNKVADIIEELNRGVEQLLKE